MPLIAKTPTQPLLELVRTRGGTWSGHVAMVRCPDHDDRKPGLSIRQSDRGMLLPCFGGCSREDVLRDPAVCVQIDGIELRHE